MVRLLYLSDDLYTVNSPMLQRYEAALVAAEVLAVDHVMTGSIDITVPSPGDARHPEVKA